MHTLATAAAAVGRNKTAIQRAINTGRIPVTHAEDGEMQITPEDLHRIYPPLRKAGSADEPREVYQSPLLMPAGK